MNDLPAEPISVEVAGWKLTTSSSRPAMEALYREHAELHDDFDDLERRERRGYFFSAITHRSEDWPGLVVTQSFSPSQGGFPPGVLIVPETEVAFIGAGTRLLCYRRAADQWVRLWEDAADVGLWGWRRHGEVVVMSAEIEIAAWNVRGEKLWTTFVEPPWGYEVIEGTVRLDVMGTLSSFPLDTGRAAP
jgi:hypothetical protein